ncbi:MAG: vanadium-dependent haloperoxidase, partial [Candidatus Dadabacteria bacterium]|nr:vanadium-dependent haloperoxidase [Candidatus Dadabacteria bacterium]
MEDKRRSKSTRERRSGQAESGRNPDSAGAGRDKETGSSERGYGRREFIKNVGKITAAGIAVSSIGLTPLLQGCNDTADGQEFDCEIGPETGSARADSAFQVRLNAAKSERDIGIPDHPCNGDESIYPNKIGNYSKGLPHNSIGEVDLDAYEALIAAISTGKFEDFELLAVNGHLGCPDPARQRRQVNPQAGYAFDLEGTDSHQLSMRAAPAFDSAEEAGEMAELYWMALLRDVNFLNYNGNPIAQAAADDLSGFSDFRGPKENGIVTTGSLFRDKYPGCTDGPYISQFLLKDCPFGAQFVDQRIQTTTAVDFLTNFDTWLDVQNGCQPLSAQEPGGLVFCRNGRDLSQYVHIDALYQAYFVACLILLANGIPLNIGNPYGQTPDPGYGAPLPVGVSGALAQIGFGTFGGPHILALLAEVSTRALKAVWYQKWLVHRRLRPEEFGGRVEVMRLGLSDYPVNGELFDSSVLSAVSDRTGNYLLPMAFPEGSPMHTSYGSGHSTVAGACVTILKAWFDESAIVQDPVIPSADGTALLPYEGSPLTVGGELNKLASNVSQG